MAEREEIIGFLKCTNKINDEKNIIKGICKITNLPSIFILCYVKNICTEKPCVTLQTDLVYKRCRDDGNLIDETKYSDWKQRRRCVCLSLNPTKNCHEDALKLC
jgi:hypothetical protein